ncbi:hypothetical protein L218DRAFT_227895 [Marasmius fiardii PR-910]|nr:hypothetical protein L218DRAFT_227895 [Marasmius fiardii PR-910]
MATSLNTVIVDDQDSRISYSGQWSQAGSSTYYNRTSFAPRSEGAQMSFTFTGTSVAVIGNLEPGATCGATFSIDGTPSNYISPPTNQTLTQQAIWTSPELPGGNHTLVYTASPCTPTSNSTTNEYKSSISLDYLLYDTEEIPGTATIFIDDRDQRLRYSGNWTREGGDGDFKLTRRGGGKGSSVQLAFTGSSVAVYGRVDNVSAVVQASFTVDGERLSSFGAGSQNSITYNIEFFKNSSLTPGEHTLVVSCLADGPFWLDYILLRSSPQDPPHRAGTIPLGAVIGSVIGVLCLIGIGLVAWFFFKGKKNSPKNHTSTSFSFPKRGLVRRVTRYSDTADPFSCDPIPVQATTPPPKPHNVYAAPSVTSYQSTAGLLAAQPSDMRSVSDASSSRHRAQESVHTDYHNTSRYDDDDGSDTNLPPEYATTAPSGTNIGCIPSIPSLPSGSSSMQYPPPRTDTFSTMHHRHSSVPSDVGESEFSSTTYGYHPPTASRADSHYKPDGYTGASRRSNTSHTSYRSHGNGRYVVNADHDDAHMSVTELKRRQQDVVHHNPIVHTDSGVRLPGSGTDSTYPPSSSSTSRTFSIRDGQVPPTSHQRDDSQNVPVPSIDHSLLAYTRTELTDPHPRPVTGTQGVSAPNTPSLDDDGQSIAALKRRQHMLIFSPEGLSTQTVPIDEEDIGAGFPPSLPGTPRARNHEISTSISMTQSEHGYTSSTTAHPPLHSTGFVDEVPPVYTFN